MAECGKCGTYATTMNMASCSECGRLYCKDCANVCKDCLLMACPKCDGVDKCGFDECGGELVSASSVGMPLG